MASQPNSEVFVGAAVLAVAVGFVIYAGQVTGFTGAQREYSLNASFRSAGGVSVGTDVRVAGVKVGRVTAIALDPKSYRADTVFSVKDGIELPDDSSAKISSDGLLGNNYVEILPGGSLTSLSPGDAIEYTQGSVSLIDLLMKFVGGDQADKTK